MKLKDIAPCKWCDTRCPSQLEDMESNKDEPWASCSGCAETREWPAHVRIGPIALAPTTFTGDKSNRGSCRPRFGRELVPDYVPPGAWSDDVARHEVCSRDWGHDAHEY